MGLLGWFSSKHETEEEPSGPSHAENLRVAVGIGTARMRCHRDTWVYFVEEFEKSSTHRDSHVFRPAAEEEITREADGMIVVPISGSSLAALLDRCFDIQFESWRSSWNYSTLDKAIAARVGGAITHALAHVTSAAEADGDEFTIVLDDRLAVQPES
ncbi:hypothetical protein ACGILS_02370 [Streptomyces albidoflavus]|uniref:hypothetical protein n=1 Tax=Streptomyces albidoflavus TaxID=1886 RepID=UPI0021D5727C|nr:hypothetical protein [Streptomyces albidoflavus]MCU7705103.1 hypothetical protein [Streptomyces albidoflavus]